MEGYEEELITEIAKLTQKKYTHMSEVLRITREMADGLARDDKVTVQMLLGMRGEELESISGCDKDICLLLEGTEASYQQSIGMLLKGQLSEQISDNKLANTIAENVQKTDNVLRQTIALDKRMSCRLAGEDSFYNKQ